MWDMARIRTVVISRLLPLLEDDPAHQWNLAKTYEIHDWVRPALERLVRRSKPLQEREFEMLDQETLLEVAAVRERCYPVFRDSDDQWQYAVHTAEDTTINRWEFRQERGEVNVDLSTLDFSCPALLSRAQEEPVALAQDGPWKSGEFYFEKVVFKVSSVRRPVFSSNEPSQVEDRLYRVPNQPFTQHSPIFRRRFEDRGFSKHDHRDPFVIEEGVTKTDFEHLLRLFFPP